MKYSATASKMHTAFNTTSTTIPAVTCPSAVICDGTVICDSVLINAWVITQIHKLPEYAYRADKIKQLVNRSNKKNGILKLFAKLSSI